MVESGALSWILAACLGSAVSGAVRGLRSGCQGGSTTAQVSDLEIPYSLCLLYEYKHPP